MLAYLPRSHIWSYSCVCSYDLECAQISTLDWVTRRCRAIWKHGT